MLDEKTLDGAPEMKKTGPLLLELERAGSLLLKLEDEPHELQQGELLHALDGKTKDEAPEMKKTGPLLLELERAGSLLLKLESELPLVEQEPTLQLELEEHNEGAHQMKAGLLLLELEDEQEVKLLLVLLLLEEALQSIAKQCASHMRAVPEHI